MKSMKIANGFTLCKESAGSRNDQMIAKKTDQNLKTMLSKQEENRKDILGRKNGSGILKT